MKKYVIFLFIYFAIISCSQESGQANHTAASVDSTTAADTAFVARKTPAALENNYAGEYIWQEDPKGYYQSVSIGQNSTGAYEVLFSASSIKGKPGCSFEGKGSIINDTLKVPIAWRDKTVTMTLFARNDTIHVFTQGFEDRFALNYYCSGGGSLAGEYYRKQR